MAGSRDFFGWDPSVEALAAIYDAVNLNTSATGNFKKPPRFDPYPRPKVEQPKKPRTVRDLYAMFTAPK